MSLQSAAPPRFSVQDEDLLWQMSDDTEPEDGVLWIYDTGEIETRAFT